MSMCMCMCMCMSMSISMSMWHVACPCMQVRISPGHPKLLGTDPVTGHPLHHYQIAIDRGLSYEDACRMLRDKAAQNTNPHLSPSP